MSRAIINCRLFLFLDKYCVFFSLLPLSYSPYLITLALLPLPCSPYLYSKVQGFFVFVRDSTLSACLFKLFKDNFIVLSEFRVFVLWFRDFAASFFFRLSFPSLLYPLARSCYLKHTSESYL